MRMLCKQHGKEFTEYEYAPVVWSSDRLPVCPHCSQTPYVGRKFDDGHENVEENRS